MVDQADAHPLRCRCGGTIGMTEPKAACSSCGTVLQTDDVGVRRLAGSDEPWTAVPSHVGEAVRQATSAEQLIDAMVDGDEPWTVDLQRRLLHPESGGMAVLMDPRPGATALDLGTGWATLPVAVSALGASVVVADWVYLRLRLGRLLHDAPSTVAVHIDFGVELPWPDASFDVVFVDLEEVERLSEAHGDGVVARGRLLAEVRRVLRDDGTALFGTRNRLRPVLRSRRSSLPVRRRQRLRHGWAALRAAASRTRELRQAQLVVQRVFLPYPRRDSWRWLIPGEPLRDHRFRAPGARGRAVRLVLRAGLATWLVRDHYLLVRPAWSSRVVRSLGERLVGADEAPPVTMALSDARVALIGSRSFIKVPLSRDQQRALVTEVDKTRLAGATAFAPFVVPSSRLQQWHGIPYSTSPAIPEAAVSTAAAQVAVHAALLRLDASVLAPLDTTAFWHRLSSARGGRDAEEIGAAALRSRVLERAGSRRVPVGPSHGDLHPGNVLVPVAGPALLVDWNRFEPVNPLLLDAVYATARMHQAATGTAFAQSLLCFVDGQLAGPVALRAGQLLGALSPLDAATVVLLDRIVSYSLPRRRYKPWTMPPLREAVLALSGRGPLEDAPPSVEAG